MSIYSFKSKAFFALTVSAILSIFSQSFAATVTWDANGATALQTDGLGAWLTADQWWDGSANVTWTSGDDAVFGNGGEGGAVTLASGTTVGSITFNSFTGTYTIGTSTQTITLNNGITMNSGAGAATIISPITLGAAQSWANNDDSLLTIGTGAVTNGGFLLTIGGTGNTSVSSVIGGAGGLTKSGSGTLTLSGANTFTGQLTVANGTLSIASINNVSANGVLGNSALGVILGGSGTNGTLQYTGATATSTKGFTMATSGGGVFEVTAANVKLNLTGQITGSGNLIKTGAGILVLNNNTNNYTGQTIVNGGSIQIGTAWNVGENSVPGGYTSNLSTGSNIVLNGGSIDAFYDFNRSLGTGAGQIQITGGVSGISKVAANDRQQVTFGTAATLVTWGSSVFNPTVLLLNDSHAGTALLFNNLLNLGGANRTITVNNTTWGATLNNVVSNSTGTAGLIKQGVGTLTLNKVNTYNGPTEINQGTLNANSTSALGDSSATNTLIFTGGTLQAGGAITSVAARSVTLTSTGIIDTNGNAVSIAGNMTGAGGLTKNGTNTLTLSGTNNYTGTTTVNAGTLAIAKEASLNTGTAASWTAAKVNVKAAATLQLSVDTAGTAGFDAADLNTLLTNISVANTAAEGLQAGAYLTLDTGATTFTTSGAITNSTGAFGGMIGLGKLGAGTLVLSNINTYSGPTFINAGTLQIGGSGSLGSGAYAGNILNNGTLTYSSSTNQALSGIISGSGVLVKDTSAASTLSLSAANRFTGTTTVSAGILSLTNSLALQNSALNTTASIAGDGSNGLHTTQNALTLGGLTGNKNFASTGGVFTTASGGYGNVSALTLNPGSGVTNTYTGIIENGATDMSLTKAGAGTQVLQGANTYSGVTSIKNGTLTLSGSGSILGTSGITFNNGSLTLTNTAPETGSGRINANTITSNGGTLTYNNTSGINVYAETIGSVALTSGQLNIVQAVNQTGAGSQTLTLGGLTHPGASSAVTFSSAGTRTTKNMFVVSGATTTAADAIIGPWATIGTAANAQTDYAIYNGSAQVVERNTAASLQGTWSTDYASGTGTLNNTTAGVDTLSASRIINSLRSTNAGSTFTIVDSTDTYTLNAHGYALNDPIVFHGAGSVPGTTFGTVYYARDITTNTFKVAATPDGAVVNLSAQQVSAGSNFASKGIFNIGANNLGTLGILGGGTGTLAITASGAGVVTLPTTTADSLHVTAGAGAVAIHAPIKNNTGTGVLTLVKNGSGNLYLTSTTSDYSGGTVINAGTLNYTADTNLGLAGTRNITFGGSATLNNPTGSSLGTLTVNTGAMATIAGGGLTFTSATGAGTLYYRPPVTNQTLNIGNASAFTGDLRVDTGATTNAHPVVRFSSLGDAVGSKIQFGGTNGDSNQQVNVQFNGTAPLVFNNRVLEILLPPSSNGPRYNKVNSSSTSATNTWTINTDLSMLSTASRELELTGTNTGENTFAGLIGNGLGTIGLNKSDTGRWIVSGSNSYTGATTLSAGTLQISALANGGSNSSIGASSNAAGNLILNGGTLRYTGGAASTDRLFSLQASTTIDASGTGAVNFTNTGAMGFNGGATAKTLTLTGTNTGDNTIASVIGDLTAATGITKSGIGTWVLSATNTNTGATSLSGGGALILDYGTNDTNKIAGVLSLGGGSLIFEGAGSHIEEVTSTSLNAGGAFLFGGYGAKLRMNAITRAAGGTISFDSATLADTDTNNVNSILGGWATLGNDWAVSTNSGAADTAVTAFTSYTGALPSGTVGAATANYTLTGNQTQSTSVAANTVRITNLGADSQTLALAANNLTITSASATSLGGIMYIGNDGVYSISGTTGRIQTSAANQELIFAVQTGTLSVDAFVGASGSSGIVTKSGNGTLAIGSANNYTGITRVNQGALRLRHATAAGTTAGGITVQNGAALEIANGISVGAEALTITGTGVSNGGALRNIASNASSYAGAITLGAGGARIHSDASGALTLTGGVVTSLFNDVTFGGAGNTTVSTAAISGAGGLIKDGAGITTLTATNTYTGATRVSNGILSIGTVASPTGSINSSALTINGGNFRNNSSTNYTGALNFTNGTISGTNWGGSLSDLTIGLDQIVSPGNSPGTAVTGNQTWAAGGTYVWEINSTLGSSGSDPGWDLINGSGTLNITSTSEFDFSIDITSLTTGNAAGEVFDFDQSLNYNWLIADFASVTGFSEDKFWVNTSSFSNAYTGIFAVALGDSGTIGGDNTQIWLTYTAIPEPKAALLGGLGLLLLLRRRREK